MLLLDIDCNVEPYIPRAPIAFLHATNRTAILPAQSTAGLPPLPPGMTATGQSEPQGTGRWFEGTGTGAGMGGDGSPSASQRLYVASPALTSIGGAGDVRTSAALSSMRRTSGSDGEIPVGGNGGGNGLAATGRSASNGGGAGAPAAPPVPRGGSVMVSVVCQQLQPRAIPGTSKAARQLGRPIPAGPGTLLALGCSSDLRKSQLGIQRSIGTLAGTSAGAAPSSLTASTAALNSTAAAGSR